MRVEIEQIDGRRFKIRARGMEAIVDDTAEAGGPDDGFRPTELLMGALGSCMAGTMLNFARNQGISVGGITLSIEEEAAERPQRIGRISVSMRVRASCTENQVASRVRVAAACKIHNTLERGSEIALDFAVDR
jgi:uncharacterized OsmC-like protein